MKHLTTEEEIAKDLISHLSPLDKIALKHDRSAVWSFGRFVRNHYGLWDKDHPLTREWTQNIGERDIRDGIDWSKNHPDNVSGRILALAKRLL